MTTIAAMLARHTLKAAAIGATLILSATASHAQSAGPFTGLAGSWSGSGTVSLSDGTSEQIRCRAVYQVNGGMALKQNLRCASDSYKFELSSDVKSDGTQVTGSWSEASRNIYGNLQGSASGGQIDVFVEAAGFAANLTLTTKGNKQLVSISSKGQIRDVSINMVRG
ncbi:hypothetical protein RPMA_27605 [Tardiphaga alba]|uniref:Uncharacterized protein n=1 Tax=Tardiphaga alba TaxID=340268 RepID=A0ABX8AIK4_9BRAD|nr:hypothetical protein [Tardiphaga alba]QUS42165.1 hypothetical protein RPMA_27605 [Tardiphaga alba]